MKKARSKEIMEKIKAVWPGSDVDNMSDDEISANLCEDSDLRMSPSMISYLLQEGHPEEILKETNRATKMSQLHSEWSQLPYTHGW